MNVATCGNVFKPPIVQHECSLLFNVCDVDQRQILENKDITPEAAYYMYFISITSDFRFKPLNHRKTAVETQAKTEFTRLILT